MSLTPSHSSADIGPCWCAEVEIAAARLIEEVGQADVAEAVDRQSRGGGDRRRTSRETGAARLTFR
jgi:hypothetical protein